MKQAPNGRKFKGSNMKKIIFIMIMVVSIFGFMACASATTPFATPVAVKASEAKYGESVCRWVLGFQIKDCSTDEAIREAGITQVQTINYSFFHAPFYSSQTIGVRGK